MGSVVDFNDIRRKKIEDIENRAKEKYGLFKLAEDSYLVTANRVCSNNIDYLFKRSAMYSDLMLRRAITNLNIKDNSYISLICVGTKPDNGKILEVYNLYTDECCYLTVHSNLDHKERQMLLNMIADAHKNKFVNLKFNIHYNFKLLQKLVDDR